MPAEVVIVQHGEKAPGPGDPALTGLGRRQARSAAHVLAAPGPAALAASPLRRARETAAPLVAATGLALRIDGRLRERANLEPADDPDRFFADWRRSTDDRDWAAPGARSSRATALDLLAAIDDHAEPDRLVVLFGHGGATTDLLRTLLGDAELERRRPGVVAAGLPGGGLTRLVRDDAGGWVVTGVGFGASVR